MKINTVIKVLVRLFTIYYLLIGFFSYPRLYLSYYSGFTWLYFLAYLFFLAGSTVLFWFLATPISKIVCGSEKGELQIGPLNTEDCLMVGFSLIGMYFIVAYLPAVLCWCHYAFLVNVTSNPVYVKSEGPKYQIFQTLCSFALGVVLLMKGRFFAIKICNKDKKDLEQASGDGVSPPQS